MGRTLAVVAAGGALGALARWAIGVAFPHAPAAILAINVLGCLLIGVLVVEVEHRAAPPLVRPFLGTGVLGGFTTFSTASVDALQLGALGAAYAAGTLVACVAATAIGLSLARRAHR